MAKLITVVYTRTKYPKSGPYLNDQTGFLRANISMVSLGSTDGIEFTVLPVGQNACKP